MNYQTLDGVRYPMMSAVSPKEILALLRREGEFDEEHTHRQKATIQHLMTGQVGFLRIQEAPFQGTYLYGTPEQLESYEALT